MAKKDRQSPRKNMPKPNRAPNSKSLPLAEPLAHAIAIGTKEITKGTSDQQITQCLRDSGIDLKKLPPDFLTRLRGGASFKPKPDWRKQRKKSN
jgi:hypothetical protein